MPVYKLEVVDTAAPVWEATPLTTGGWVRAVCEMEARRRFGRVTTRRMFRSDNLTIFSPWYDTRLTRCRLDASHEDLAGGMIELINGIRLKFTE